LTIAYDKEGLDMYDDYIGEARTTRGIRRIMRRSALVRDRSNKCLLEVDFTSNGINTATQILVTVWHDKLTAIKF